MPTLVTTEAPPLWAKVIDHTRCIGCHACTTACKSENEVPLSVTRTYVKYVDVGAFPQGRRAFQVTRCNQCEDAPCVAACPTAAMYRRPDGIVDFDKSICIGCKACIAACPYDAIFINPDDHSAEKCNFCAHRLDVGLEPACVVVCPTQALMVGDMNDPRSGVSEIIHRDTVTVRRPEKETRPKVFYKGATQATLDPLAARRPDGGLFLWSEQGDLPHQVPSGHSGEANSSAAALLSYDVPHRAPWDWRVSAYTWTKSISAGAFLVPMLLGLLGVISWGSTLWTVAAPAIAMAALAVTGVFLVWDLEHPERFYLIFTRPQWRSWLVRGGVIITVYGGLLAAHLLFGRNAGAGMSAEPLPWLMWPTAGFAVMTSIYTAYLFAQSKGRDMWQNPMLPLHLLVQAFLAGAGVMAGYGALAGADGAESAALGWIFAIATGAHLFLVGAEATMPHPTAHARMAVSEMVRGRFAGVFWTGVVLGALGLLAPWAGIWVMVPGLVGLALYEHAYVQAGQSVPLA